MKITNFAVFMRNQVSFNTRRSVTWIGLYRYWNDVVSDLATTSLVNALNQGNAFRKSSTHPNVTPGLIQSERSISQNICTECVLNSVGSAPGPSLTDPVQTIAWGGTLPTPRRLLLSGITSTVVVLGGNLGGTTSRLLTIDKGEFAKKWQLDVLFPVGTDPSTSYKRCIDGKYGYEFIYPSTWLADQTLAYRAARRAEMERGLDLPPVARPQGRPVFRGASVVEPVAAYGPAGSTGEENISVIVAPIFEGFNLSSMGSPEKVATQFLKTIAPLGVSVEATLLNSSSRSDESGQVYYMMEYTVKSSTFFRHNMSVITSRNNNLFTFNAQVPEQLWTRDASIVKSAAQSFKLTASRLDSTGFPVRL